MPEPTTDEPKQEPEATQEPQISPEPPWINNLPGLLVDCEGMLWSPTPSTMADDEALIDWESECFLPV